MHLIKRTVIARIKDIKLEQKATIFKQSGNFGYLSHIGTPSL